MSEDAPKSAYELAMERLRRQDQEEGVVERPVSDERKAEIAEVRKVYEARVAEREILHRAAVRNARSPEELAQLEEENSRDRDRFARERDRKIEEIRKRAD
jgi:hypothetical protein